MSEYCPYEDCRYYRLGIEQLNAYCQKCKRRVHCVFCDCRLDPKGFCPAPGCIGGDKTFMGPLSSPPSEEQLQQARAALQKFIAEYIPVVGPTILCRLLCTYAWALVRLTPASPSVLRVKSVDWIRRMLQDLETTTLEAWKEDSCQ